jgi:hypothetical protein
MPGARFNSIVIIDAIPNGEFNTARKVLEDLEIIYGAYAILSPVPLDLQSCVNRRPRTQLRVPAIPYTRKADPILL